MQRLDPFPTPENAEAKAESFAEVVAKASEARAELLKFNPESLNDIPGSEFSEALKAAVARVEALFPEEKALPEDFTLGFQSYANYLPPEDATGELAFQVGAMEHLLTELANAGVPKLLNLYRAELPQEDGKDWDGSPLKGSGKSSSRGGPPPAPRMSPGGSRGRKSAEVLPEIAHRMPIEVTFRGTETATREFLTRLGNSEEYFFQVRLARVVNPTPIPSTENLSDAPAAGAGDIVIDAGDDIVVEGTDIVVGEGDGGEAAPPTQSASPVLEKVSGGEDLNVFLKLDLLLFLESEDFPEVK
jgi:hypothetical protein